MGEGSFRWEVDRVGRFRWGRGGFSGGSVQVGYGVGSGEGAVVGSYGGGLSYGDVHIMVGSVMGMFRWGGGGEWGGGCEWGEGSKRANVRGGG